MSPLYLGSNLIATPNTKLYWGSNQILSSATNDIVFQDAFDGSGVMDASKWSTGGSTNSAVSRSNGAMLMTTSAVGDRTDIAKARLIVPNSPTDQKIYLNFSFDDVLESYVRIWMRSQGGDAFDFAGNGYYIEINASGNLSLFKYISGNNSRLGSIQTINGVSSGAVIYVEFFNVGSNLTVRAWTGNIRPTDPTIMQVDSSLTTNGLTGIAFNNGASASQRKLRVYDVVVK